MMGGVNKIVYFYTVLWSRLWSNEFFASRATFSLDEAWHAPNMFSTVGYNADICVR